MNIDILGDCTPTDFCEQNSLLNNFYLERFLIQIRIFGSVKPRTESTFPFQYNVIY